MSAWPRAMLATLALAAGPGAAVAQALVPCAEIEATSRPDMMPTRGYAVAIEDGMLRRIVLELANGQRSTTDLSPMGGGVSVRLVTFPDPRDRTRVTAVFNRAVVSPDGTVLMETWLRRPQDAAPQHNSYRLRCPAPGTTK